MTRTLFLPAISLITGITATASTAKPADLQPILAKPGAVTVDETFSGTALPAQWLIAKGDWQVRDGSLVGREKTEDKHAAVLALAQPNRDSIIRFCFKLDGADGLGLSFNHAKGHLFRVNINAGGVMIMKDKDKKDPASKGGLIAKAEGKFAQGQWHTVLVEVKGTKVAVQADNGIKFEGTHPELAEDKTGYRFVLKGATLALDDVKAWETQP